MRRFSAPVFIIATIPSMIWSAEGTAPAVAAPAQVAPAAQKTPDVLGDEWVKALRRNDLAGGFALLTTADQAKLSSQWQRQMRRPDAYADLQLDTVLRLVQNSAAVDQAMAMAQPYLAQINPRMMAKSIEEIAGFLGMAAETQKGGGAAGGLDYAGLRDWLKDLAAWVPVSGLADQAKAKAAIGHLVKAVSASGLRSAAEVRAMPLGELLVRLAPAMPGLKQALGEYDVKLDALLDSFRFSLVDAVAGQATVVVGFTALDKPRTVALKLVQKDGSWQFGAGNDNPLTGLSQLVMMTLLMQGMGAGAPAQPPAEAVPVDDGAL